MEKVIWEKVGAMEYEHQILVGEPKYPDFMYAFVKDTVLSGTEIIGLDGRKERIWSDDPAIQKEDGAVPVPSYKKFVDALPIFSTGIADYVSEDEGIRFSFGLEENKSLKRKGYVIIAKFVCPDGVNPVSDEAALKTLERISENAAAYTMWK